MYHDTININFKYLNYRDINFDYSFFISKNQYENFSPIKYSVLLKNFYDIGFDIKYLKFNDIYDDDTTVYCSYNYQPNFNVFFVAYKKLIEKKDFHLSFEYGNIVFGKFYPNNMNFFAGISFTNNPIDKTGLYKEEVVKGKIHLKTMELYQIIDKNANVIAIELADPINNFEQHFFERYEVKHHLRKYKLSRLKNLFNDQS